MILSVYYNKNFSFFLMSINLYFLINYKTYFGHAVYVLGNIPELGNWNIHSGFRLKWN